MSDTQFPDNLVSTSWLADHMHDPEIKILDASWYLPPMNRNAASEYSARHIPGAMFFDIDAVANTETDLPHMLPTPEAFSDAVSAMGISNGDHVIVYSKDLPTAARAWWTFRIFGHRHVSVLDGGLNTWLAENRPTDDEQETAIPGVYKANLNSNMVVNMHDVLAMLGDPGQQILDVRPGDRFTGETPEPREGMRSGHMPGAMNISFFDFFDPDSGLFLSDPALESLLEKSGIDLKKPLVTTCGSGITACIAALALERVGHQNWAVYDGSWTEWGARDDVPVER